MLFGGADVSGSPTTVILVFSLDREARLEEMASQRHWLVVQAKTAEQALREIRHFRLRVAIVQFAVHVGEALELIGGLRGRWPQLPLIAVSSLHNQAIESAVRGAGASCYFSDGGAVELVDQAVGAILAKNAAMAAIG